MTRLETYCKHVRESRGMEHQLTLTALREYLKITDPERLISEINLLEDPVLLRIMQEAGVPHSIWKEYLEKLEEVK